MTRRRVVYGCPKCEALIKLNYEVKDAVQVSAAMSQLGRANDEHVSTCQRRMVFKDSTDLADQMT